MIVALYFYSGTQNQRQPRENGRIEFAPNLARQPDFCTNSGRTRTFLQHFVGFVGLVSMWVAFHDNVQSKSRNELFKLDALTAQIGCTDVVALFCRHRLALDNHLTDCGEILHMLTLHSKLGLF